MKVDLRDYLQVGQGEVEGFTRLMVEAEGVNVPGRAVARFVARMEGARLLAEFRRRKRRFISVAMMVDVVSAAFAKTSKALARELSVPYETWDKLVSAKIAPETVPARKYARFARAFGLDFDMLRDALVGSHFLHSLGSPGVSPRFAHSAGSRRRAKEGKSCLRAAYDELRLKSARSRRDAGLDESMERFLETVRECLI